MSSLLLILLSSVLVSYFAIASVRALQPFYSDDVYDSALGVAIVTASNLVVLAPLCWLLDRLVLHAWRIDYLAAVLSIAIVLILILLSERILERSGRWLPRRPGFLLMMSTQSVLLGVPLLVRIRAGSVGEAVALGIGAGGSFALLLLAFCSMQLRLRAARVPAPFRHAPISLITLGIMALAVMGFTGLIRE
jgi:electron transport complex protein RnfA